MASSIALRIALSHRIHDWLVLTKFRISVVSTLTAAMGYVAASGALQIGMVSAVFGTLCLAMAASVLNEVEERDVDAKMRRTSTRPIPGGQIGVRTAILGALSFASVGTAVLYTVHGATTALLGLLALFWYNVIYTPLKRISAFAVVPGSVIGALPPAIGWSAAGGSLDAAPLTALCFVFFVWQVPHFWLLALRHRADYERSGLPTLTKYFSARQVYGLIFTWTAASVAACALLWVFQAVTGWLAMLAIGLEGGRLLFRYRFMFNPRQGDPRMASAFMDINRFALVVMGAVAFDALAMI